MRNAHLLLLFLTACSVADAPKKPVEPIQQASKELKQTSLIILGTTQDAGSPHIGCEKHCCANVTEKRYPVALGLIDPENQKSYLFEASPDLSDQLRILAEHAPYPNRKTSDGVFLTHAHMGHYTGLMYYGREALGADSVPVYAMPRMHGFLASNGPWEQLVQLGNIELRLINERMSIPLGEQISVEAIRVPHRDEYSETVGFRIHGPQKSVLFIPDIDKWEKWDRKIEEEIAQVDFALLDGTFFHNDELNNRDMDEIPHPFVIKSLDRFNSLPKEERNKIHFIHFNHTNPLLDKSSPQFKTVEEEGYHVAEQGAVITL